MKFPKRTLALVLAVLMLTAALSACSGGKQGETQTETDPTPQSGNAEGANTGEPVMGGDLRVGIAQDLDDTFDPHNIISAGTREVLFNIYEGLVKPDNDGNLVPAVAESVDISEAGDSFTFTLREGVKFHNGETVTAEDVVYSVSRAAGLGADKPMIDGMQIITSVEATDEKTVVVTLGEPNIEMLALLTAGIIPAGSDPAVETVGTGFTTGILWNRNGVDSPKYFPTTGQSAMSPSVPHSIGHSIGIRPTAPVSWKIKQYHFPSSVSTIPPWAIPLFGI